MKHFLSQMQRTNDEIRRKQAARDDALHPLRKAERAHKRHRRGHMPYYKEKMAKHKARQLLKEARRRARHENYDDQEEEEAGEEAALLQEDNNPDGEEIQQAEEER